MILKIPEDGLLHQVVNTNLDDDGPLQDSVAKIVIALQGANNHPSELAGALIGRSRAGGYENEMIGAINGLDKAKGVNPWYAGEVIDSAQYFDLDLG